MCGGEKRSRPKQGGRDQWRGQRRVGLLIVVRAVRKGRGHQKLREPRCMTQRQAQSAHHPAGRGGGRAREARAEVPDNDRAEGAAPGAAAAPSACGDEGAGATCEVSGGGGACGERSG